METSVILRVTGLRDVLQFVIQFGASVYVARTLTPQEIGTFSVAMATIVLATTLRASGIGVYLVQHRDLQREHIASAFGLTLTFSFVLGLIVLLASPFVADLYGAPALEHILWLASVSFFIAPPQVVATGLLSRDLRFGRLAMATLCASAAGAGVTITLASLGFGAISMAWGALCNSVISGVILCKLAPPELWTRPRFRTGWREIWSITSWALFMNLIQQFGNRVNEMVIGKTLNIAEAALIERAQTLPRMIWRYGMPPVLGILAPIVAHELRANENLHHLVIRRMRYFGCVFVPLLTGMASQSEHLLLGIYGENWTAAVEPAVWMCLSSAVIGQFVVIQSVMYATGRTREAFIVTATNFCIRLAVLAVTSTISILVVAIGGFAVALLSALVFITFACRLDIFRLADLPRILIPGLICGSVIYVVGRLVDVALATSFHPPHLVALAVAIAVQAVSLWLLLLVVEPDVLRYAAKVIAHR